MESSHSLRGGTESFEAAVKEENEQSEVKLELDLHILYFVKESGEIRQRTPTPDPLDMSNINDIDEAWFLGLPPEQLQLIKESSKRRVRSTSLQCTVCEKPLHLHQRGDLHRFF